MRNNQECAGRQAKGHLYERPVRCVTNGAWIKLCPERIESATGIYSVASRLWLFLDLTCSTRAQTEVNATEAAVPR
jgi:hypothetical protein